MIELTVAGLSDDKTALVLTDSEGQRFRLAADALAADPRARVLFDQSRRTTPEAAMDTLRPRDIQGRVRAGESAEDISDHTGVPLAKILPYALPVMDERRHIAETALKAAVRGGDGGVLAPVASARLRTAGVRLDDVEWDAWRREDGRWTLRASYFVDTDEQQADFVYDAAGRYVMADDAIARWLIGAGPARRPAAAPPGQVELDLGVLDDEPLAPRRGLRAVSDLPIDTPGADADWMVATPSSRASDPGPRGAGPADADPLDSADDVYDESSDGRAAKPPLRGRGKGRASVPTWDEIMFGSGDRV